jgi:hypothetical protein
VIHKYNMLYLSYYPWSDQGSRYTNLAVALSAHKEINKLMFVNPINSIGNIDYLIKEKKGILNIGFYRNILNNPISVYSCIAPIPLKETFKIAKIMHIKWFYWSFRKLIKKLKNNNSLLLIQNPSDEALAMISIAKENNILTIFDWADLFEQFAGSDRMRINMSKLCRKIANEVDIVFCVSTYLRDIALKCNANSYLLPNAVLNDTIIKDDIYIRNREIRLRSPQICYYGLINPVKLDYGLIREIISSRPNWRFIFIGPQIDPINSNEILSGDNFEYLGQMDKYQLHNYLQRNVDLCINPYRIEDEPNKACSPMKLYETLGDGLPFVSTEAFDPLDAENLISMGNRADELISKIEIELWTDSKEKRAQRILFARNNTWDIRANQLMDIIKTRELNLKLEK